MGDHRSIAFILFFLFFSLSDAKAIQGNNLNIELKPLPPVPILQGTDEELKKFNDSARFEPFLAVEHKRTETDKRRPASEPVPMGVKMELSAGRGAWGCNGMPIHRIERKEGGCEFAILTAAHCAADVSSVALTFFSSRRPTRDLKYVGGHWASGTPYSVAEVDTAILYFHGKCDAIPESEIGVLATSHEKGHVSSFQGDTYWLYDRDGKKVTSKLTPELWPKANWSVRVTSGPRIEKGTSGSAVRNSANEIVGFVSTSNFRTDSMGWITGPGSHFGFSPFGVPWAREKLKERYGSSVPALGPAPQENIGPRFAQTPGQEMKEEPPPGEAIGSYRRLRRGERNSLLGQLADGRWAELQLDDEFKLKSDHGALHDWTVEELLEGYLSAKDPRKNYGDRFPLVEKILIAHKKDLLSKNEANPKSRKKLEEQFSQFEKQFSSPPKASDVVNSFSCVKSGMGWKPKHVQGPPLGRDPIRTREGCERIISYARNNVVCSNTALGWKPTHYSGSTPVRRDYGFWGSSTNLEDCLLATLYSTREGVCYWGGSGWYAGDIHGRGMNLVGPFTAVGECNKALAARVARSNPPKQTAPPKDEPKLQAEKPPSQPPKLAASDNAKDENSLPPKREPKGPLPHVESAPPATSPKRAATDETREDSLPPERAPKAPPVHAGPAPGPSVPASDVHTFGKNFNDTCMKCHAKNSPAGPDKGTVFPGFMASWEAWEKALKAKNPEALAWMKKVYREVVKSDSMRKHLPEGQQKAFARFVEEQHEKYGEAKGRASAQSPKLISLTAPGKQDTYMKALQNIKTNDEGLREKLANLDLIWDDKGVPRAHQAPNGGEGGTVGIRPLSRQPVSLPAPFIFNGKDWKEPFNRGFGLADVGNEVKSFFALKLPRDEKGNPREIAYHTYRLNPDRSDTYAWIFPKGTEVMEILYKETPQGPYVFEVRTRTKETEAKGNKLVSQWDPNGYRPYARQEDFLKAVESLPGDEKRKKYYQELASYMKAQTVPDTIRSFFGVAGGQSFVNEIGKIFHEGGKNRRLSTTGAITHVPGNVPTDVTKALFLDKPLESVKGAPAWAVAGGMIPQNYHGGAVPFKKESCTNCHEHSNRPVREMMTGTAHSNTHQYGHVSGSDGVLSFHPFDPAWVNSFQGGQAYTRDNRRIRKEISPIFKPYDSSKHPASLYMPFAN